MMIEMDKMVEIKKIDDASKIRKLDHLRKTTPSIINPLGVSIKISEQYDSG
jgi:hypothetical protein